jgi:hypothetical protein
MQKSSHCDQSDSPIPVNAARSLKPGGPLGRNAGKVLSKSVIGLIVAAILVILAVKLLLNLLAAGIALVLIIVIWAAYRGYHNRIR